MRKSFIFLFAFMAVAFTTTLAQDTLRFSLDSCLRYAYAHNFTVQTSQLNKNVADVSLQQARYNFTPSLSASASETLSQTGSQNATIDGNYGLNANMTIFNGLSNLNTYRQSQLGLQQSSLKVEQSKNSITSQIVQAYLTILMNLEKLVYQQKVLKTTSEQLAEGEVKLQVGKILESDYLLLDASYQSALSDIENTRLTIESNRLALKSLLCITTSQVVDVESTVLTSSSKDNALQSAGFQMESIDTVKARAYRTLPDVKISEMNVQVAEYDLRIARAAYSPTLSLSAGASYYGGNTNTVDANGTLITNGGLNSNLGLSLSIPIWSRGTAQTQVAKSKINLQQVQLASNQTLLELNQEIENQYYNTTQALNKFAASEKLERAYDASYNVYVTKYKAGAVTTVELLQQQDKYLSALNDYLQNKYSFILADKVLDVYMGNPISL